ncbi:hypothetical protein SteCoe_28301 [Stentor coeruleus]|uniref:Uncharacterized protein n=1 Tax=Stentor coeruleus TaxID=5963 RepID=A0A1R2B8I8_9CILI|nr:hypothetical protein SteCoe_28301 [Stentor coeruleus]
MGCGSFKPSKKVHLSDEKTTGDKDFISIINTNFSLQCNPFNIPCRRFKVPEEPVKLLTMNLNFLKLDKRSSENKHFTKKLTNFLKDYLQYCNIEGYFSLCLHKICIQEYSFRVGLIVMFISILSNYDTVKTLDSCPFITVDKSDSDLIKAWRDYSQTIETFYSIYITNNTYQDLLSHIQKKAKKIDEKKSKELAKKKKYLLQAEDLLIKFTNLIKSNKNDISSFFVSYTKTLPILQELSKIAIENKVITCEKIVHCMIKKNNTTALS